MVKIGQRLRKNAISLDVINLETSNPEQNQKLQKLVDATKDANETRFDLSNNKWNNNYVSHYIQVQPGIQLLSDYLLSTPVLMSGEGGGPALNEFGMASGIDPELEMVLRISLEEERARKQKDEEEVYWILF